MKIPFKKSAQYLFQLLPVFFQEWVDEIRTKRQLKYAGKKLGNQAVTEMRSRDFSRNIQNYWIKNAGMKINQTWHFMYANFTGSEDVRFIPQTIWGNYIHTTLNDPLYFFPLFGDKNFTDVICDKKHLPKSIFKVIRGRFYDNNNNILSKKEALARILKDDSPKIIKPSVLSRGQNVFKVTVENNSVFVNGKEITEDDLHKKFGENYIVQIYVEQHPELAKPHPYSLNTIRINTLRLGNEIHELLSVIKFGANESVIDNTKEGFICSVNTDGTVSKNGFDRFIKTYEKHPTTGYFFNKIQKIPNFRDAIELCKMLHKNIPQVDFASWDVAITKEGNPCIIEVNSNPTVWMIQFVHKKPFFGELTEDVLKFVRKNNRN